MKYLSNSGKKEVKVNYNSVAVAIKYAFGKSGEVPKVIATGRGLLARKILKLAEENEVPIKEEPKLAESLADFAPGTEIPEELWEAMAEILAQIYMLDGKSRQ